MAQKPITMTDEGQKKIIEELDYLKNIRRKEVIEAINIARSFGDLSENSEYDEARDEQGKVETRIKEIEDILKNARVINESEIKTDAVNIGAKVKIKNHKTNCDIEYYIVGPTEADPLNNKISDQSPIGSALIGAKNGETVIAVTPGGEIKLTILDISK